MRRRSAIACAGGQRRIKVATTGGRIISRMAKSTRSRQVTALEGFAEDLGKLLGTAQAKAEGWLNQRQTIAKQLAGIRDTASSLLQQLAGSGARTGAAVRRGVRRAQSAAAAATGPRRRRRRLSAKARKAISEAQKRRWAARKAAAK